MVTPGPRLFVRLGSAETQRQPEARHGNMSAGYLCAGVRHKGRVGPILLCSLPLEDLGTAALHRDSRSKCFVPPILAPPEQLRLYFFFSSSVNTTSGFEIKGGILADEFTARCWLLECTSIDLIQSTRNRSAPPPSFG